MSEPKTSVEKIRFALGLYPIGRKLNNQYKDITPNKKHKFTVEATLTDGTTVQADSLEQGSVLYVLNEDGTSTPCPAGTYETDDLIIDVDANGTIEDVQEQETGDESDTAENTGEDETDGGDGEMADATAPAEDSETPSSDSAVLAAIKTLSDKLDALCTALSGTAPTATTDSKTPAPTKTGMRKAGAMKVTKTTFTAVEPKAAPLKYELSPRAQFMKMEAEKQQRNSSISQSIKATKGTKGNLFGA